MRTIVTFTSAAFNTSEPKEYFINECCYGDDLCKWLIKELSSAGTECDTEPGQEDFGWFFNFQVDGKPHCLVCVAQEPDEGASASAPATWILTLERAAGFLASLFGGRDKDLSLEAANKIHAVLSSSPDKISEIKWHEKKDFEKGNDSSGTDQPG
jgi:hypothetical protein